METHETEMVEAQGPGGLSRRDLITRTAVAGGLVWAAPVLLASPVAAQTACACAPGATLVYIKVASSSGTNCPNVSGTCLDPQPTGAVCDPCLLGLITFEADVTNQGNPRAIVTVQSPLQVLQVCAQIGSPHEDINVTCPTGFNEDPRLTVVPGPTTTITLITDAGRPINFLTFVACIPAGTPVPGCPNL